MKIGVFTESYRPSTNGVVTSIESFRQELERRGHKVYIFCPHFDGALKQKNVFRLPAIDELSPKDFPIGLPVLPIITRKIKPLKLDIVHIQAPFFIGALGHRVANKLDLPEVHTYHTFLTEYTHYIPTSVLQPFAKFGLKKLSKLFCNYADIVIAPSTSMRNLLLSYGVKSKIVINPTGINLKEFRRLDDKEKAKLWRDYQLPQDKKFLLFAGRLAKEKNIGFLLDCFKIILKACPDTCLAIAGSGPFERELKSKTKKMDLEGKVYFLGMLSKKEVGKFFGTVDIFTFTSITETQGLVITEAMAGSTPVVAINSFGPKDIVSNGVDGFLSRHDRIDFSNKVIKLLRNDKLREEFGKKARENVKKFSIENRTDRLIEIFKEASKIHAEGDEDKSLARGLVRNFFRLFGLTDE